MNRLGFVGVLVLSLLCALPAQATVIMGKDSKEQLKTVAVTPEGRPEISVSVEPGSCVGANLTASASNITLVAGVEYRIIALSDFWLRYDGQAATTDAPSEFFFKGDKRLYTFGKTGDPAPVISGILTGTLLSGSEVIFCAQKRAQ